MHSYSLARTMQVSWSIPVDTSFVMVWLNRTRVGLHGDEDKGRALDSRHRMLRIRKRSAGVKLVFAIMEKAWRLRMGFGGESSMGGLATSPLDLLQRKALRVALVGSLSIGLLIAGCTARDFDRMFLANNSCLRGHPLFELDLRYGERRRPSEYGDGGDDSKWDWEYDITTLASAMCMYGWHLRVRVDNHNRVVEAESFQSSH